MKEIKKIDVTSLAVVSGLIYAIIGFIMGVLTALLGSAAAMIGMNITMVGFLAIILYPIMFFIAGFIGGAIFAIIYNYISSKFGGIKIDLT